MSDTYFGGCIVIIISLHPIIDKNSMATKRIYLKDLHRMMDGHRAGRESASAVHGQLHVGNVFGEELLKK